MRALVTGCCGFIGSVLIARLIQEGWNVEGVDDLSGGDLDSLSTLNVRPVPVDFLHIFEANKALKPEQTLVINGDFTHDAILSRIRSKRYDVVFHLAARVSVPESIKKPVETHETNVFKTLGLFQACQGNVDRVVFASSAAVYGNPQPEVAIIREDHPTNPISPYGLQKLHAEQYAALLANMKGTKYICLRIFNVFGPRQRTGLIADWLNAISNNRPIEIHGGGYQTRDLCYVENVVDAFLAASQRGNGPVYNVGTGISIPIRTAAEHLKNIFPEVKIEYIAGRLGDISHSRASISKISKELEYSPRIDFVQGMNETIKSWRLNKNEN